MERGDAGDAEAPMLALDWSSAAECPGREVVVEGLQAMMPALLVPPAVAEALPEQLRVTGALEALPDGGYEVQLAFARGDDRDARSFQGPDCGSLTRAATLVIAVALDPVETAEHVGPLDAREDPPAPAPVQKPKLVPEPEPALAPEPKPALELPVEPTTLEPAREPPPRERRRPPRSGDARGPSPLGGSVGVRIGGGLGPVDAATTQLGLDLALASGRWRVDLLGLWMPPRELAASVGPSDNRVRFDSFLVGAHGCGVPSWRTLEFPLCAGVEAGATRGVGVDPTPDPREAALPWVTLTPGAGLRWVASPRVAVGFDLAAPISLVRGGFRINELVVQRLAPVGARGLVAVDVRFP
ncbi:hypothetical protein PPSIR1_23304 [Plesiocystis pacifica SIR-1]|uniref:Uncharacterized protein n=2 Tax=Plesiocystis pacifica TaxID=191768 RepID=A6GC85_9BACT|nr:hypothetical protein PPSIR1_23304 [Plesiocystis pacifica SIR-1]